MEVVIIMAIIGCVVFFLKRTFNGFVYAVGCVDILLRLLAFLKVNLLSGETVLFINKWFPVSIPAMIDKYTDGTLYSVLLWIYVGLMIIFEFYCIRSLWKKR